MLADTVGATAVNADDVFGGVYATKLLSCRTLLALADSDTRLFVRIVDSYSAGVLDDATDARIGWGEGAGGG